MPHRLSQEDIEQRLIRLSNLERLHGKARERITKQEYIIKQQAEKISDQQKLIETLLIRVAELEKMIFGSKRAKQGGKGSISFLQKQASSKPREQRSADSYQRSIPREEDVSSEEHLSVEACAHCGGPLRDYQTHLRYEEDVILPQLLDQLTKTCKKYAIEKGYCKNCGVWTSARDLRGQTVSLGKNVRLLISYLVTILDNSYEQVQSLLSDLYNLSVSEGEIAQILSEQALSLLPEYERLKTSIRGQPGVHMDETSWSIQDYIKRAFAWVMSDISTPERVYKLATSRGKGNAEELMGDNYQGIRITDCFPGYKNLPGLHQICWAHLHRKARDLAYNENLPPDKQPHCLQWYEQFSGIYQQLRSCLEQPFDQQKRKRQAVRLRTRIRALIQLHPSDPKKLHDLKLCIKEYDHALFTCMAHEGVPCDNNRAERDLRRLVIKRKKSFGSKTLKGARTLEILLSVCWSTWHMRRGNFFPALARITEQHRAS